MDFYDKNELFVISNQIVSSVVDEHCAGKKKNKLGKLKTEDVIWRKLF